METPSMNESRGGSRKVSGADILQALGEALRAPLTADPDGLVHNHPEPEKVPQKPRQWPPEMETK